MSASTETNQPIDSAVKPEAAENGHVEKVANGDAAEHQDAAIKPIENGNSGEGVASGEASNGHVPEAATNGNATTESGDKTAMTNGVAKAEKPHKSLTMTITCKTIRAKFPSVTQMSTQDLQKLLDESEPNVVLLDVRPEEEFRVSRLTGSHRVDPDTAELDQLLTTIKEKSKEDTQVVAYCSVGYRSSQLVQKLQQHLKKSGADALKIANLEGSLFKWANENRPMVSEAGDDVTMCHQYNKLWGKLLRKEFRHKPAPPVKPTPEPAAAKAEETPADAAPEPASADAPAEPEPTPAAAEPAAAAPAEVAAAA